MTTAPSTSLHVRQNWNPTNKSCTTLVFYVKFNHQRKAQLVISPILEGRTFALVWWQLNLSIWPFQFQQWICCKYVHEELGIFFISSCLSNVSSLLGMSMACFKASLFLSMRVAWIMEKCSLISWSPWSNVPLGFKTTTIQFLDLWIHKRGITVNY